MATPMYKQLVKAYAEEIKQLRKLAAADEAAKDALQTHWDEGDRSDIFQWQDEQKRLAKVWDAAHYEYMIASETLAADIVAAYNDVPFAQARDEGIAGFWREANI